MIMNDLKDVLRMTATVFLFVSFLDCWYMQMRPKNNRLKD